MRYLALLCCAGLAWAQGTAPKAKADEYETSAKAGPTAIGAEYMVHSFSGEERTFLAQDYLVVEVAVYPAKGYDLVLSHGDFALRVDGKAATLRSAATQEVARALERQRTQRRGLGTGVIIGGPMGGGPYGAGRRAPRVPAPDYQGNVPDGPQVTSWELATRTALPEGTFDHAVAGYLFFYYRGNASKIRTVDLLYGDATLKVK